jgi:hypothetical protein
MPSSRGVSRRNFSDVPSCRFFLFVLLVWSCFDSGCTDDRRDRDMRDLLSGGASIHWDGHTPASICLLARVHTRVPSPVRSGLRCVGKLYAGRVCADSIRCVACAEPAARATIVSKRVKEAGKHKIQESKKDSTTLSECPKNPPMKRQFIICCFSLVAAASICLGQESPSPSPSPSATPFKTIRSATKEATIEKLEKSVTDAFKNKQTNLFKQYLDPEFSAVDAEGIKDADAEVEDMQKTDLRNYSFADMKVTLLSPKMAIAKYKVTTQSTSSGRDTSGTYYAATVWNKRSGKWLAVLHTFVKTQ